MTHKQFMAKIVEYYSDYKADIVADETYKYIQIMVEDEDLETLFSIITEDFSTKWKTPPDKAVFKESRAFGEIKFKKEQEYYRKLEREEENEHD